MRLGPGDGVVVPPCKFVATVNFVLFQPALPVIVDADPQTFLIETHEVETAWLACTRV